MRVRPALCRRPLPADLPHRLDYRPLPTRAQRASFAWIWPLHTATLLGNFANFLAAQDQSRPEIETASKAIEKLIAKELRALPPSLRSYTDIAASKRSVLARLILIMLAHDRKTGTRAFSEMQELNAESAR